MTKRNPHDSGDPDAPIRLVPSGDETDEWRDELNAKDAAEMERLDKLIRTTRDKKLRAAYEAQWNLRILDILADWLARMEKYAEREEGESS